MLLVWPCVFRVCISISSVPLSRGFCRLRESLPRPSLGDALGEGPLFADVPLFIEVPLFTEEPLVEGCALVEFDAVEEGALVDERNGTLLPMMNGFTLPAPALSGLCKGPVFVNSVVGMPMISAGPRLSVHVTSRSGYHSTYLLMLFRIC